MSANTVNNHSMKQQIMYYYLIPQAPPKKPYRTRYLLTPEEAAQRFVGAVPDLFSKVVREVYEPGDEIKTLTSWPMPGSAAWKDGM